MDSFSSQESRRAWVLEALLTNKYVKKLLDEVFECLKAYLQEKLEDGLEHLWKKLIDLLAGPGENKIEEVLAILQQYE